MTGDDAFNKVDVMAQAGPTQEVIDDSEVTSEQLAKDDCDRDNRCDIWNEQNGSKEGFSAQASIT